MQLDSAKEKKEKRKKKMQGSRTALRDCEPKPRVCIWNFKAPTADHAWENFTAQLRGAAPGAAAET